MENKYYIPSLEEFHVGFEFEHRDLNYEGREEFQLCILESDCILRYPNEEGYWNYCEYEHMLSNLVYDLGNNDIRVKYLDKEDIESLGFKYIEDISEGDGNIRWWDLYILNNYELGTYGWFDPSKNLTSFEKNLNGKLWIKKNGKVILENARIKNKSELKQILKIIGVN